jgi:hypothetical protein
MKPDDTTMRFARLYIPSFPSTPCRFSCIERAWVWQRVRGRPSSLVLVVAKIGAVMLSRVGTVYAEYFSPSTTWPAGVASRWPELYILSLFPQAGTSCVSRTSESFATADGGFDEHSSFCRRQSTRVRPTLTLDIEISVWTLMDRFLAATVVVYRHHEAVEDLVGQ